MWNESTYWSGARRVYRRSRLREYGRATIKRATADLRELTRAGDKGIPTDLLNKATCIVVIPGLKKGGFIVGAEYGKGFFSCRRLNGVGWSAPGAVRIAGGKFGLLIGGAETDLVMLVMNRRGMDSLLSDHFDLGGEASAAAGPVGRNVSALTDAQMRAEILTYSRQRGIFGGLDLTGAVVTEDKDSDRELYGSAITNKELVANNMKVPAAARQFIHELDRLSSRK
ncbi:MAG: lipid-binding SYLF domain-containing protein [Acidobacteriaceae bacterium]|nr:lipid-binding SYLF domain-containing protein [Acidobacteriaceae bacterium]